MALAVFCYEKLEHFFGTKSLRARRNLVRVAKDPYFRNQIPRSVEAGQCNDEFLVRSVVGAPDDVGAIGWRPRSAWWNSVGPHGRASGHVHIREQPGGIRPA